MYFINIVVVFGIIAQLLTRTKETKMVWLSVLIKQIAAPSWYLAINLSLCFTLHIDFVCIRTHETFLYAFLLY